MTNDQLTLAVIQDSISNVTCLFSLPEVYLRIRELMDDKNSNLDDFSKIVGTDPNLTACVLRIVNSAYFGFTGQIANIHQALNLLGIGTLHDLVLSISAVGSLSMPNEIIELSSFWRRSIYCGVLSKLIAEHKAIKDPGGLFVIGLLHEIGHLLFFFKFPKQSMMALSTSVQARRSLFEIEREIFNVHYGEAGQQLMKAWNLPVKFQIITEFHPEPGKAKEHILETAIVHIAHHYACSIESGDAPNSTIDTLAWQLLHSSPDSMDEILNEAGLMSRELEKLIIR
jgi:HD-like signal output (HDOD) protein